MRIIQLALFAVLALGLVARADRPKPSVATITAKRDKLNVFRDKLRELAAKPEPEKLTADQKKTYAAFVTSAKESADAADALAKKLTEGLKAKTPDLDQLSQLAETESLKVQMTMERHSKAMSTQSNVIKKVADTLNSIIQNMK
jgi:hypothetical protein